MSFLGAQNSIALGVQGIIAIDTGTGGGGSADYLLAKSLRFRSSASAYLNRTFAAGNQKTWTWSGWVKRGTLSANQTFFGQGTGVLLSGYGFIRFDTADTISIGASATGAISSIDWNSTPVYRDPAAWYHVVAVLDTTQGTGSDRFKLYVNGAIQSGTFATTPSSSADIQINRAAAHQIAVTNAGSLSGYYDGELAEINFVDGQALAPTAFGAYSTYNQWLPIEYAGTYGTNGFYLPFNSVSTSSFAGSFNGTSQRLNTATAGITLGTNNFTVEGWINPTAVTGGIFYDIYASNAYNSGQVTLRISSSQVLNLYYADGSTYFFSGTTVIIPNKWYHVALVRTGTGAGSVVVYLNGVAEITATISTTSISAGTTYIGFNSGNGYYFAGYISNLRVVNGTAVYTGNFTPPVAPLTAITNTALLTLQNATIVDNSTNAFTITNTGTVVTSVQYPFTLAIAADSSGNANNWTPNNISLTAGSTYDSLTDVPTLTSTTAANYAVLNPLDKDTARGTISDANLKFAATAFSTYNAEACRATMGVTTGKWYYEFRGVTQAGIGNAATANLTTSTQNLTAVSSFAGTLTNYIGASASISGNALLFQSSGYSASLANSTLFASYASGDVVNIAVDFTAGKIWVGKNGTYYNSGDPGAGTNATSTFTAPAGYNLPEFEVTTSSDNSNQSSLTVNFGQQPFVYTAPSGFLPLNTFNIAAGTVTTSGTFTGNLSTDGPFVFLNGTPTAMTINGNAVTFGTQADKLANGFKVRSSSILYNLIGSNTYVATTVGAVFKYEDAQSNP